MGKTLGIDLYPIVFVASNGLILQGLGGVQLHSEMDFIAIGMNRVRYIGQARQFGAKCMFYRGATPAKYTV